MQKQKGHIDVLFASAGIGELQCGLLVAIPEKSFDNVFNVNVRGTLFTVQKALPLFRDGGSIILNTSISNEPGLPGRVRCIPQARAAGSLLQQNFLGPRA